MRDARVDSALADLRSAVQALTEDRQRYLQRLEEPRFATVPSLLGQLRDAVARGQETGAVSTGVRWRLPVDAAAFDLLARIGQDTAGWCALAGLRRRGGLELDLRGLAGHASRWAATDVPAVLRLADDVAGWAASVRALLAEQRGERDLPGMACPRCPPGADGRGRTRVRELRDGQVLLVPALTFAGSPMPTVRCRGCGHAWQGEDIHKLAGPPETRSRGSQAV